MTQPCTERATLERIEKSLNEIHQKLFIGNGTPALTVRVDRMERVQAVGLWAVGLVTGGGIVWGTAAIVGHVIKVVP
jgi:hypothetical protein